MILTGTSGFSFADWKGTVYPKNIKNEAMLAFYEKELGFKALELNFTYYALPSQKAIRGLCGKTSPDFKFVVKAFKGLTHDIKFHPEATSGIAYFRLHGRNMNWFNAPAEVRYDYNYTDKELKEFLPNIQKMSFNSKTTLIFFNNCHAGSAAKNAITMAKMLLENHLL